MDGSFRVLKGLDWQFHDVTLSKRIKRAHHAPRDPRTSHLFVPTFWEQQPELREKQSLKQMWFTGAPSDVGGGYSEHELSDVALKWMIDEATEAGLDFRGSEGLFDG